MKRKQILDFAATKRIILVEKSDIKLVSKYTFNLKPLTIHTSDMTFDLFTV